MDVQTIYFHIYVNYCTLNGQLLIERYFADVKSAKIHDHSKNFRNSIAKGRERKKHHTQITLIDKLKTHIFYETLKQMCFLLHLMSL